MAELIIDNDVGKIYGITLLQQGIVKNSLSYKVKGAYWSKAYQNHTWDGMKTFFWRGSLFPVGLAGLVYESLTKSGCHVDIIDRRVEPESGPGLEFLGDYRDYQDIEDVCIKATRGIIDFPTGSGKTAIAGRIIAKLDLQTLYVVPTKTLLYQVAEELEFFLGIKVGRVGDGKKEYDEYVVVATIQTLRSGKKNKKHINRDLIMHLLKSKQILFIDEAHYLGADSFYDISTYSTAYYKFGLSIGGGSQLLIRQKNQIKKVNIEKLAEEYNVKDNQIQDISDVYVRSLFNGRVVWKNVKAIHKYVCNKKVYRIHTQYGKVIEVTEDHSVFLVVENGGYWKKFPSGKAWQKIGSIELVKGEGVCIGNYLIAPYQVDEDSFLTEIILYSEEERFLGRMLHCYRIVRTCDIGYLLGYVLGDGWIHENRLEISVNVKEANDFEVYLKCILWADFRPKRDERFPGQVIFKISNHYVIRRFKKWVGGKRAWSKVIPNEVFGWSEEARREVVRGMVDSDGHISKRGRNRERIYYVTTSEQLADDLITLLSTLSIIAGKSKRKVGISKRVKGKRISYSVNWSIAKGSKYCGSHNSFEIDANVKTLKVKSIEEIKLDYVYDLSVEDTENFFANEILVHNTGTAYRDDAADIMLRAATGKVIIKISSSELIKVGILAKPTIKIYETSSSKYLGNIWLEVYRDGIVRNDIRNALIIHIVKQFTDKGKSVLILVKMVEHGEILTFLIPGAVFVSGSTKAIDREDIREQIDKKNILVIVATKVYDEGVNIPSIDCLVQAGGGASQGKTIQRVGRVLRKTETKHETIIIDFKDSFHPILMKHSRKRIKTYRSESEFIVKEVDVRELYSSEEVDE